MKGIESTESRLILGFGIHLFMPAIVALEKLGMPIQHQPPAPG